MKKCLGLLICLLLVCLCSFAAADILINEKTFPDPAFRNYVKGYDENEDGKLSDEEIAHVQTVDCNGYGIRSMKGISVFSKLEYIVAINNLMTELDVSSNPALDGIDVKCNKLTSLNLSNNAALGELNCDSNMLTSLDVSKCTSMYSLHCMYNRLTSLNVSNCRSLSDLWCADNKLTSLTVSKNSKLNWLNCSVNELRKLDVSKNKALHVLYCSSNKLTSLTLGKKPNLSEVICDHNQLASIDISGCPLLVELVLNHEPGMVPAIGDDCYGWAADDRSAYLIIDKGTKVITGETAGEVIVSGGKYILNEKKTAAIFVGPEKKNAKSLTILDTVKIDGKTYKVTEIKNQACKEMTKLTSVTIGKNVKVIEGEAFFGCTKARKITFTGTAVKQIGAAAFGHWAKKVTVTAPKKVLDKYVKLLKKADLTGKITKKILQ